MTLIGFIYRCEANSAVYVLIAAQILHNNNIVVLI